MTTIDYYNENAEMFVRETLKVDMTELYQPFLKLLPENAKILDAGCGSGRDSLAFKKLGHQVTAFDGSIEIAKRASEIIGQPVKHLNFNAIDFDNEFNGIWACASLLHVPKKEMKSILLKLVKSLKKNGVLYSSFKYGKEEYIKGERLFNCYDEESISALLNDLSPLKRDKIWVTTDLRQKRQNEKWLNVLLTK